MPANPMTLFQVTGRAMSAQLVRMNAAASNLANAGTVTATEAEAYRPLRTVFGQQLDQANGLSTVQVNGVIRSDASPIRQHEPGHPLQLLVTNLSANEYVGRMAVGRRRLMCC